jgi:SHS2 domain-containing protein
MVRKAVGFQEIEHTADWELLVWGPDLAGLLEQAARGMNVLAMTRVADTPRVQRQLRLPAGDPECLLVSFLTELLWQAERDNLAFDTFDLVISEDTLDANLQGAEILSRSKEIKAVTFHNLSIRQTRPGLEANIVLDV